MAGMTYTNLLNRSLEFYFQGDYLKAYDFISRNAANVKGNNAQIYNFRYCMASRAKLHDLAMDIMREAVIEKGFWYSYDYLMGDDDLKPLHDYKEFNELADICREREIQAKRDSKPELKAFVPEDLHHNNRHPLIIALHGNQESILVVEDHWSPCVMGGNILALAQSSQIELSGAYNWNDVDRGTKELKGHYDDILKRYNADPENIILGGFSAGARIALNAVLNDFIQVKGLIFTGPWLPEIDEWEPLFDGIKAKGIKSYIICGDKDEECFEGAKKLVGILNERNMPNIFKVAEGLKHEYPENFDRELDEAVRYIIS